MIKIIAIGNSLMGDDGVALRVIDELEKSFKEDRKIYSNIRFIKAETDFNFALDNIEAGDFVFIIDSTLLNLDYGTLTQIPVSEFQDYSGYKLSIHNMSLISLIKHLDIKVEGFILGIEVAKVNFSLDISEELKKRFQGICNQVYSIVKAKSLEYLKKGGNSA